MNEYNNPILSGFYPDPSICRVHGDYYLVNSTFAYFPGIPVFHSRDLVQWELIGHVLERKEQLDLTGFGVSKGIFAPSIRYHNGTFYVTCTVVDGKGNFVVTASDPAGPWSDPLWLPEVFGIDPSLFFENDKSWLVYNSIAPGNRPLYNGHRTIRIQSFNFDQLSTAGYEKILVNGGTDLLKEPRWIEGPHLFKRKNFFYLIAAEGGTGYDHSVVAFRSKNIEGPFLPCPKNPILTQRHGSSMKHPVTSTGHADLVETSSGEWHAVFLGCRPYEDDHYNTGRETFLVPVTWRDDWPVLNDGYENVQYHYPLPHPELIVTSANHYSGNFSVRDEFSSPHLDRNWMFLRTPKEKWYHLEKGKLAIQLRPQTCAGFENPSFIARRQQHLRCSATCSLLFVPAALNEKAGLAVFLDQDHFYFLCLSVSGGHPVIELFCSVLIPADDCRMHLIHAKPIFITPDKPVQLRVTCVNDNYAFYYSTGENNWLLLQDKVDTRFLSTRTAGGFVGCTLAMYVTSLGRPSISIATFNWFDYKGDDEMYGAQS